MARPKIVVLGMMTRMPVAGVVWQNLHYLLGFEQLGFEAWYVEAHARTPTALMRTPADDSTVLAAAFIERELGRIGMERRWAFHALHDDGRHLGLERRQLEQLYRDAALIVNLHGGTIPREEHAATGRLIYLETDPVEIQVQLHDRAEETIAFLEPHSAFFTFGENYGRPGCGLPVDHRFDFRPTRQPVVLDFWNAPAPPAHATFTTIGNLRQPWRDLWFRGERYSWSKHHEMEKVLDLPSRTSMPLELALASYDDDDARRLRDHGWAVRSALDLSTQTEDYRGYITASGGEFTVAKDQNVRLRTGWFSDRSATYLAAGRPVVTQDTGFGDVLPTGAGLFAWRDVDDAVAALESIAADPGRHQRAARDLARDAFAADVVLRRLLDDVGLPARAPSPRRSAWRLPFPAAIDLAPKRRRPLELDPSTEFALSTAPIGAWPIPTSEPLELSVVVITFNQLPLTRLCVETLLAGWDGAGLEVVIVDNASSDGTRDYLARLADRNAALRVLQNEQNVGFVAGCNQGLAAARAARVVILNNDTVPPPGSLRRLARHLDDPTVGLVGPVTNHAPNEARIPVPYRTYGELLTFGAARAATTAPPFDYEVATLFCAAVRRDVLDAVGLLDEAFGLGLFDDDDFSRRVRAAGFRVVCAEDAFVHHVGEASFGDLVPDGTYSRLFEANRAVFEAKWQASWSSHHRRVDGAYEALVRRIHDAINVHVPAGAGVAMVSRGDDALVALAGRPCRHVPAGDDGSWAGFHPADGDAAVAAVADAEASGMRHLVIPATERWWLDHYTALRDHLERHATLLVDAEDVGVIYALDRPA